MSVKEKFVLFIAILILGLFAHYMWGDNNVIEEISEDILKQQYGLDVEFSGVR